MAAQIYHLPTIERFDLDAAAEPPTLRLRRAATSWPSRWLFPAIWAAGWGIGMVMSVWVLADMLDASAAGSQLDQSPLSGSAPGRFSTRQLQNGTPGRDVIALAGLWCLAWLGFGLLILRIFARSMGREEKVELPDGSRDVRVETFLERHAVVVQGAAHPVEVGPFGDKAMADKLATPLGKMGADTSGLNDARREAASGERRITPNPPREQAAGRGP